MRGMPDGAGDENAPPKAPRATVKGQYSISSQAAKKEKSARNLLTLSSAVSYARGHAIGAKKAVATRLFPNVSVMQLRYALEGNNKRVNGERLARDILTAAEQCALRVCVQARVCACSRARVCTTTPKHPPLLAHRPTLKMVEGRRRGRAVFLLRVGIDKSTAASGTSSKGARLPPTARPATPAHHPHLSPHHPHRLLTFRARATTRSTPNPTRHSPDHRALACTEMQRFDVFDFPKFAASAACVGDGRGGRKGSREGCMRAGLGCGVGRGRWGSGGRVLRAVLLCLWGHTHTCLLFTRIVVLCLDIVKRSVCFKLLPLLFHSTLTPSTQAVASCPPCHPC